MAPIRGETQESWQLQELKERLGMGTRLETSLDSLSSPPFARGSGASQGSADSSFCDEAIADGSRVRVLRGRRFRDFGTGDAGSVMRIDREAGTCVVAFDGVSAPVQVALRHLEQDVTSSTKMVAPELNRDVCVPSPPEHIEQRALPFRLGSSTLWSARSARSESHADSDQDTSHIHFAGATSPGDSLCVGSTLPPAPINSPVQEAFRLPPSRPDCLELVQAVHENGTSQLPDGSGSRCDSEEPSAISAELSREVVRLQNLLAREVEERALGLEKVEQHVEHLRSRYGDVAEQLRLAVPPQEHIRLLDARFGELMQAHNSTCAEYAIPNTARVEALASRLDKVEVATANTSRLDALEASIGALQAEVLGAAGTTEAVSSLAAALDQLNAKLETSILAQDQRLQTLASQFAETIAPEFTEAAKKNAATADMEKQVQDLQCALVKLEKHTNEALEAGFQQREALFSQRQAESLAEQLHVLSSRLDVLDSDISAMQARLNGADGAVASVQAKLSGTDAVLDTLAAKMDATVSDVDNQAQELQSAISQVEQHASEAIKVGCRMSETLTEHVKLAQDKDGILDLIQARMEAFGEVEKRASEAMEIGQRVCKVLEAQSESVDHRSKTEELHKAFDGLNARVEALGENFAAEVRGQVGAAKLEEKCRQVLGERLAAEAITREKALSQMEERCRQAVLMELRADASLSEAARKQDLDAATARLRSELEAQSRAGTDAAIARLRSEFEAHVSRPDPQLLSPGFARRGFSPPPGPARQSSRSPSPTASQLTSTRSAHSRERTIQAHWAVQPAPAAERQLSPGQPGSLPRASSPQARAMSPGSPLTFSLPPPPLQAMAPATAMWPSAPTRPAPRQAMPAWRQRPASAGGAAAGIPHAAHGASSSSLRALGQGGPAGTLCSMCGNMSMDDSVMCRRCTLSHSRGRARNVSPVPMSAHPMAVQPLATAPLLTPGAAPPAMAVTMPAAVTAQQPVAAMHWARPASELPPVPPSGTMGIGLGSGSSPPTGSTTPTIVADEVRTPGSVQGLFRAESSTITNSARSNREGTSSVAGDSGAAKVIRGASSGPESLESPAAQPVALAPSATASPPSAAAAP